MPQAPNTGQEQLPKLPLRDTRKEVTDELDRLTLKQPLGGFQGARLWEIAKRFTKRENVTSLSDYLRDNFFRDTPAKTARGKLDHQYSGAARRPSKGMNTQEFKTLSLRTK